MKSCSPRMVIYVKDIMTLTGRSERTSQRLLSKIRKMTGKTSDQYITIEEFCRATGLNEEEVKKSLLD